MPRVPLTTVGKREKVWFPPRFSSTVPPRSGIPIPFYAKGEKKGKFAAPCCLPKLTVSGTSFSRLGVIPTRYEFKPDTFSLGRKFLQFCRKT